MDPKRIDLIREIEMQAQAAACRIVVTSPFPRTLTTTLTTTSACSSVDRQHSG